MTGLTIRALSPDDATQYQRLRLRGLREAPEAFGSTYAEDAALSLAAVAERLQRATSPAVARVVLGAFVGETLVGFVGCLRQPKAKTQHTAVLWGTYVAPEARGRGAGRALLAHLLAEVGEWPGVERLTLSVVERAAAARRLYAAVGFTEFGREPDAFRQDGVRDTALHLALTLAGSSGPGAPVA